VHKNIHVVGAVVVSSGKVLCVQRGPHGTLPGLWEFPGGKIEPGETAQEALRREIAEELECQVSVGDKVTTTRHEYAFGIVHLTTFYCELIDGSPRLSEHADMAWRDPADLRDLAWAPADIPAIQLIEQRFREAKRIET
jgi:8-oxo-dGTP diphosphatase